MGAGLPKKRFWPGTDQARNIGRQDHELVHPVELDFEEDKAFSDTWYVLVNDRWKAEASMDRNFRNAVMDVRHDHVLIEIVDHTLVIGHNKPASPDACLELAEFVVRLCSNC